MRWSILRNNPDKDKRIAVSREHLESEITEAVRKFEAGCKGFVGVVIERLEPKSHANPNWTIRGVRFGRANRDKTGKVLATVVESMQREFTLAENEAAIPQILKQSAIDMSLMRASRKQRRVKSGKHKATELNQSSAEVFPNIPVPAKQKDRPKAVSL